MLKRLKSLFVVLLSAIYVVASVHSAQSAKFSFSQEKQLRFENNSDVKFTPNLFYQISLAENPAPVQQVSPIFVSNFQAWGSNCISTILAKVNRTASFFYFNTADRFFLHFSNCDIIFPFHYFT